jgi:hypothetical protein
VRLIRQILDINGLQREEVDITSTDSIVEGEVYTHNGDY